MLNLKLDLQKSKYTYVSYKHELPGRYACNCNFGMFYDIKPKSHIRNIFLSVRLYELTYNFLFIFFHVHKFLILQCQNRYLFFLNSM